jgi:hypothetical protein
MSANDIQDWIAICVLIGAAYYPLRKFLEWLEDFFGAEE